MKDTVKVDSRFEQPEEGDIIVLCSDGLSGPVSDSEMLEILNANQDLKAGASKLIERANANGGPDNITVVLVRWIS
jgi:protein phosphatase